MSKQEYTVGYLMNILKLCSPDALIDIRISTKMETCNENKDHEPFILLPITSVIVHKTEDERELVSFIYKGNYNE